MLVKAERLPTLIEDAANALAKATSAGEVLEAHDKAKLAYDAAKSLSHMKAAHDEVMAACRKVMADALVIETRAQCRLADEYDAAQERGEVNTRGHGRKGNIPNENISPTVTDIGLTSKLVHEARKVRDAEKENPGVIKRAIDESLQAGKEPTRADVKRAVSGKPKGAKPLPTQSDRHRKMIELADQGRTPTEIADYLGITTRQVHQILLRERIKRAGEDAIDPATLAPSAQQRLDAAIRAHKRKLDAEFEQRVLDEIRRRVDEMVLPSWKKQIAEAQKIYNQRKGVMDKGTFNAIRRALHPDSRNSISDKVLAEAFDRFMRLEKYLLSEKDSPTEIGTGLPNSWDDWEKAKQAARMARRAKRNNAQSMVRR